MDSQWSYRVCDPDGKQRLEGKHIVVGRRAANGLGAGAFVELVDPILEPTGVVVHLADAGPEQLQLAEASYRFFRAAARVVGIEHAPSHLESLARTALSGYFTSTLLERYAVRYRYENRVSDGHPWSFPLPAPEDCRKAQPGEWVRRDPETGTAWDTKTNDQVLGGRPVFDDGGRPVELRFQVSDWSVDVMHATKPDGTVVATYAWEPHEVPPLRTDKDALRTLLGELESLDVATVPHSPGPSSKRQADPQDVADFAAFRLRQLGDQRGWWLND
ncbi:hypothetical protein [Amycolatopsis anabasis]|uniref:hypothetical protein n=1 Tax=Amycolatopsis anabasis TaxID=1840409 RepID=UPI00131CA9CA|nr:hypothetical protein [Amycolatopsis anabasis]